MATTLRSAFDARYLRSRPNLTPSTIGSYRVTIERFSDYLGRPATKDDLTDRNVAGFVLHLLNLGKSPLVANSHRKRLQSLWERLVAQA